MSSFFPLVLLVGSACVLQVGCGHKQSTVPAGEPLVASAPLLSTNAGQAVLAKGLQMTKVQRLILPGGCWDYANAVYNRAGYPSGKRVTVFKGSKANGPYADADMIQPGDWLYYINHSYRGIEHSAIFVKWEDKSRRMATMLSYGGENRKEPARYRTYDLSNVYQIIRGKN